MPQKNKKYWHETHILPSDLSKLGHTLCKHKNIIFFMVDLAWPCRDKKTPLLSLEEELMMEAWSLLKKDEDLLPLSTFHLIIKLYPSTFSGDGVSHLPTCKPHMHSVLINYFLSVTLSLLNSFLRWDIKDYSTGALQSPLSKWHPKGFHIHTYISTEW